MEDSQLTNDANPSGGSGPSFDQVNADYQKWLGRPLSQSEYDQYWANRTDYNASMVFNSQEGLNYANQQLAPKPGAGDVTQPAPTASPSPAPAPTTGGNGLTPGLTTGTPTFSPPGYSKPPAFSYSDFVAPKPEDLQNDPWYKFTLNQQQGAIQKSAAAKGILNTGGTIYDLLTNANDIASSGYANLYNRDLSTYQTNRGNAADTYRQNYDSQFVDPYRFQYQGAQDAFNSNVHASDLANSYGWASTLFDETKLNDLFDKKYRLWSGL